MDADAAVMNYPRRDSRDKLAGRTRWTIDHAVHALRRRAAFRVPLEVHLHEGAPSRGPLGAKSAGEVPILNVAATVASGIADATGLRPQELPLTPPRSLALRLGRARQVELPQIARAWADSTMGRPPEGQAPPLTARLRKSAKARAAEPSLLSMRQARPTSIVGTGKATLRCSMRWPSSDQER